jgi:hypothetical protein
MSTSATLVQVPPPVQSPEDVQLVPSFVPLSQTGVDPPVVAVAAARLPVPGLNASAGAVVNTASAHINRLRSSGFMTFLRADWFQIVY